MLRLVGLFLFSFLLLGSLFTFRFSLSWIGSLPGDLLFSYGTLLLHLPFTTALLFALFLSVVLYFFSRR